MFRPAQEYGRRRAIETRLGIERIERLIESVRLWSAAGAAEILVAQPRLEARAFEQPAFAMA
ncbi:MAG: hypothetical protein ACLQI7_05105, partial [Streptosporangiaceae bacterium]